jgi:hypothetical protein
VDGYCTQLSMQCSWDRRTFQQAFRLCWQQHLLNLLTGQVVLWNITTFVPSFFFWRYIFEVPKPTRYIFNKLNSSFSKVLVKFFRPSSRGFSLYWTCSANACKDTWRLPVHKRRQCWFTIPLRLGHRASYSLEGLHAPPCLRTARVCLKSLF